MRRVIFAPALVLMAGLAASTTHAAHERSPCDREVSLGSPRLAYAAFVRTSASAYRSPGRGAFAHFKRHNVNGYPTLFAVRGAVLDRSCTTTWYHVQLPLRPNGVTGYVPARAVSIARIRTRIVVDLSARRLTLFRRGRPVRHIVVGIGSPATPTPTGRFYVNQRLVPANRAGPWGPAALGVSAFSPTLHRWTQGGPVAIHGTSDPSSIGRAVSHGCVRVRNELMRELFAATPAGTPVLIRR
jgi:lipoprotein-anchoring transpeptidase ErfK/SrfK